jgi:hypothetical protein
LEVIEIKELTGQTSLIGRVTFDISDYAPMLDKEPYKSNPKQKLTVPLKLALSDCTLDPSASLDITLVFDNLRQN